MLLNYLLNEASFSFLISVYLLVFILLHLLFVSFLPENNTSITASSPHGHDKDNDDNDTAPIQ